MARVPVPMSDRLIDRYVYFEAEPKLAEVMPNWEVFGNDSTFPLLTGQRDAAVAARDALNARLRVRDVLSAYESGHATPEKALASIREIVGRKP